MAKVLIINASPIAKQLSISYGMAEIFKKAYLAANPEDQVEELDLNEVEMAHKTLDCKNMGPEYWNEEDSNKYIEQLKNTDKVIFVAPMTNFNISALARNYLDHVLVADKTFSYKYSKDGDAVGLLSHLKVQILATQGAPFGWYLWGSHTALLKGTFQFVGAKVKEPLMIDGTKTPIYAGWTRDQILEKHKDRIIDAASKF
ncbi:FMN-dependent NADH-azoreductase [Mycoplasma miroungirhinis]|uniref:FMN dependent NADH:quinone oxidoreductase n=1 Tax=Mycoplasma miroungirhinis TaxID=754516 RepID=A0A6M4JC59_9MOLU|nr:FMN-dependent NADH-azoreductase [Mycoplasma miroungirhinis]QJR43858.1 FMN-dependent NADH-azoreductase [Mycoplasma miroungirhinis]